MPANKDKTKFSDLIEVNAKFKVLPMTNEIKDELEPFVKLAIKNYSAGQKYEKRINEFGNYMEGVLKETSDKFSRPTKANGTRQSSGYPDLKFNGTGVAVYTEVKVFSEGSEKSDMRSFYLSTFDKITTDAMHVVIGFEHNDRVLTGRYHIIDMSDKTLTLKMEYACNNKHLYN